MKRRIRKKAAIFLGAGVVSLAGLGTASVGAVTEKSDIDVQFTFNDVLSVSLSSPNLVISDLAPGTSADSNIITVTVSSNNPYGYTLTSNTGDGTSYNTNELVHATSASATPFSSISPTTTIASLNDFSNNQWGYSYSLDNGTTWINANKTEGVNNAGYSGLPYSDYGSITLKEKGSISEGTGDDLQFKIAAKADATQLSGEYNNIINFAVVGGSAPVYYMQDVATWGSTLSTGDEITAIDNRDNKSYTVAKLADNNIWMTQNLDHDIATTTDFYTYANTDIGHGSTPNTSATWTASTATYATGVTTWNGSYVNPESYDPGNVCWDGTMNDDWDGTLDTETASCSAPNHYHIGNYYNWTAAVAMNDSTSYTTDQTDVDQSICPAGWRLPTYSGSKSYDNLVTTLSLTAGSETSTGADGNIQDSPVYFPYAGYWYGSSDDVGSNSFYWSSVVVNSNLSYVLYFNVYGGLGPQGWYDRDYGRSVRCVAR